MTLLQVVTITPILQKLLNQAKEKKLKSSYIFKLFKVIDLVKADYATFNKTRDNLVIALGELVNEEKKEYKIKEENEQKYKEEMEKLLKTEVDYDLFLFEDDTFFDEFDLELYELFNIQKTLLKNG